MPGAAEPGGAMKTRAINTRAKHTHGRAVLPVIGLCLATLAACGGSPGAAPGAAVSAPSVPASEPTKAATSATRSPRAAVSEPSKADDLAQLKRALITPTDLGKPWVQPKQVAHTKGKAAEACPGKPSLATLAPARAGAGAAFTHGTVRGASIANFSVFTMSDQGAKFRTAWSQTIKACAAFQDTAKLYVVTTAEGPRSLPGTDEVLSRRERLYYDASHTKLAYARHYIVARTGRVLSEVEYDFLTPKSDPTGKDFTPAQKLLALQLTKTKSTFSD